MAFSKEWERIHAGSSWGRYPDGELVRWGSKLRRPARVLDLGAGQGASTWFLQREGFTPVAVDGSTSGLRKAAQRIRGEGLPFMGAVCDVSKLPFRDGCFDAVVDVMCSAHNQCFDMIKIFQEAARVLKPGGNLLSLMPTSRCAVEPFAGKGAINFVRKGSIPKLLGDWFFNLQVLRSSYQRTPDCTIELWVITANRR